MFASSPFPELLNHARQWLHGYALALVMMTVGAVLERRRPADILQSRAGMRFNVVYGALYLALAEAMRPLMAVVSVALVNALGGGRVVLASHG
ncbi:hypothetical protein [Paraburkholderia sp. BL23I1N1]|uniref:hypothetical protein n=1 Tax=Paraburkholderia sp. BL23I1N1 TaxID=1938802 RepID=UPI00217E6FB1|nr:hypothetical protein [Paraburkholderia sp. BL23I1N1]